MIHRIKTVTWEVRSHGFKTTISDDGLCEGLFCLDILNCMAEIDKPMVKKVVWHLQDVLKCMRQIEREKASKIEDYAKECREQIKKEKQAKKGAQDERD